ncbi:MAG: YihY/virulence factor BrkB family protein [Lachnospiraceae bacterium]|nr:YihY/virulence factor BrkB family protein [Lachnospiraceae bacterium]
MKKALLNAYREIRRYSLMYKELEVSAHAAAASFYIFLSIIPLIGLFLTIIPYSPITRDQLSKFLSLILPGSLDSFVDSVTLQMYGQGPLFLILSAVLLVWSAGKGMQSITRGLNAVNGVKNEKRPFLLLRFEACVYTTLLVIFLIVSVVITFVAKFLLTSIMKTFQVDLDLYLTLLESRFIVEWFAFALLFSVMYGLVPYRKRWPHKMWRGGLFAGVGCAAFSKAFSYYLEHFHGFSMYGSMATIMITMIWIFFFMTIFFAGALWNVFIEHLNENRKNRRVEGQNIFESEVLVTDIDKYHRQKYKKKMKEMKRRKKEEEIKRSNVFETIPEEKTSTGDIDISL